MRSAWSPPPNDQKYKEGETYIGSDTIVASGFDTTGYITAYDMSTGKIDWQNELKGESCYSGTVTTAGGLLFVGKNDGNLVAYDERNRQRTLALADRRRRQHHGDPVRRRRRRENRHLRRR